MAQPTTEATRFFLLLLVATALPYLVFPLAAGPLAGVAAAESAQGSLMFLGSSAHVASSFFFYSDPRMRRHMLKNRGRFVVAPVVAIAAMAAWFTFSGAWIGYGICAYWVWQTHHYTRQNHGILAFAGRASGSPVTLHERTAVTLTGVAGVIGMVTFVAPYRSTVLAGVGWQLHMVALGAYAAAWIFYGLSLLKPRQGDGPLRRVVVLVLMLFYAPLFLTEDRMVAVGCYAMAHGLQYLVFMGYVAKVPTARLAVRAAQLVAFIAIGGALLESLQRGEWGLGAYRNPIYGAYLGVVIWHFLLDAGVWRLSEPQQRAYMGERFVFLGG